MRVLYVATEVSPFVKVGGLGDVAGSLPIALHKMGVDIRIAVPRYEKITGFQDYSEQSDFKIIFNWKKERVKVYKAYHPAASIPVYFFENKNHISSGETYFVGKHKERIDRFVFFSKAVSEWVRCTSDWQPDIIHVNDWHPCLVLVLTDGYKKVISIHNHASNELPTIGSLRYMLSYTADEFPEIVKRRSGKVNLLLNGVKAADYVNAVSPTYAKEITKSRFCGEELSRVFFEKEEENKLTGILNGIDEKVFDPGLDNNLAANYRGYNWESGKKKNKEALLKLCGWKDNGEPLLGFVARFTPQKGADLMIKVLKQMKDGFRLVILGTGREEVVRDVREQIGKHPDKFAGFFEFDLKKASLIYAGADMFLVPSRFEPCGLTQMIAMRYGTVPIVRKTGGLADTVFEGENGFVFSEFRVRSLERAIKRACRAYDDKIRWKRLVERCMKEDFSWDKPAKEYLEVYKKITNNKF